MCRVEGDIARDRDWCLRRWGTELGKDSGV